MSISLRAVTLHKHVTHGQPSPSLPDNFLSLLLSFRLALYCGSDQDRLEARLERNAPMLAPENRGVSCLLWL